MKILIMSDSHGSVSNMLTAVERESPGVILHLGDNIGDCSDVELMYPDIMLRAVRGNCDRNYQGLDIDEFVLEDKRFVMTHGHLFNVKMGRDSLKRAGTQRSADILLFGHTHTPHYSVLNEMIILNPGSIGAGTKAYAILEIKNGEVVHEFKTL